MAKKIMFNDRYGLTQAVLSGRKTMTRRIVPNGTPLGSWKETEAKAHYKVGEIVAIAQSYKDAGVIHIPCEDDEFGCYNFPAEQTNGWTNKMFVRADLMPHQIRITNIRVERLRDISYDDILAEGISTFIDAFTNIQYFTFENAPKDYSSHKTAFRTLIDKVSGKGTWGRNPYVFVYEFELVK